MELSVYISYNQIERLMEDPETELIIHYPRSTFFAEAQELVVIVRISDEMEESITVH